MTSAEDALAAIGMNLDEVVEIDNTLRTRPAVRDGRICICGHGVSKHTDYNNGVVTCKPSKMDCPCKKIRPVLEAQDTRPFLRRTQGSGSLHALSRGMAALATQGKSATWIIPLECDRCEKSADKLSPVPVTLNGIEVTEPTGYDALLCDSCRKEV